jgi:hypothetical protein
MSVCTARGVSVEPCDRRDAPSARDARQYTPTATPRAEARSQAAAVGWRRRVFSHGMTVGRGRRGRLCLPAMGGDGGALDEETGDFDHKTADMFNVDAQGAIHAYDAKQPTWADQAQEQVRPLSITGASLRPMPTPARTAMPSLRTRSR